MWEGGNAWTVVIITTTAAATAAATTTTTTTTTTATTTNTTTVVRRATHLGPPEPPGAGELGALSADPLDAVSTATEGRVHVLVSLYILNLSELPTEGLARSVSLVPGEFARVAVDAAEHLEAFGRA
jgi:hypothetical protein